MATTVNIDLRLSASQRTAIRNALTTLEAMCDASKFQTMLAYWNQMDAPTRQNIIEKAPLFARLLALAAIVLILALLPASAQSRTGEMRGARTAQEQHGARQF